MEFYNNNSEYGDDNWEEESIQLRTKKELIKAIEHFLSKKDTSKKEKSVKRLHKKY